MMRLFESIFVVLLAPPFAYAQAQVPSPEIVIQGQLAAGFSAKRTIDPNVVHRYLLPVADNLFLHVLINQVSVDVAARIKLPNGTTYAEVDATNIGWESLAIILHDGGGGFLDLEHRNKKAQGGQYELEVREIRAPAAGDEVHVEASIAASEARRSASAGTKDAVETAVKNYEQVLTLWRISGDRHGELMTRLSLATLSYTRSQYQQGSEYSKQALEIARSLGDRRGEGSALNNVAMCEVPLGMLESAREHMTAAAEAFRETGSLFAVAAAKTNLGLLDYQTGRWSDSLLEYGEARMLARQIGDQRLEAYTLHSIAVAYIALGDCDAAESFLDKAFAALNRAGDKQAAARAMSSLGRVKLKSGHVKEAEQLLREALDRLHTLPDRRAEADALNFLGQVLEKRSPSEARIQYEKALVLSQSSEDRRGESSALHNIGRLRASQGEVEAGVALLDRSLAIRREIAVFDLEAESLYSLAVVERSRENLSAALAYIEEALRIVESSRHQAPGEWLRSNYLATRSEIYEFAIDLCMEMHRRNPQERGDVKAFQIHERVLARALIDRLGISREQIVQGVDKALLQKSKQLEDLIGFRSTELLQMFERPHKPLEEKAARSKLESALAEHRLVEAQIRGSSREYRNIVEPEAPSIQEIQRELAGKRNLLLEFSLSEPQSYVWAITDTDFRCYPLPGRAQIEQWAAQFVDGLSRWTRQPNPNAPLQVSRALGELLKRPLADHPGKNKLLIVAEGKLSLVPFAAIQVPGRQPGLFRYLIELWEPSMLPSAQAGLQLQRRVLERLAPNRGIAILADPVYSADDERMLHRTLPAHERGGVQRLARYPRLAFTRQEADAILSLKPSKSNLRALDFAANVRTAKKELGAYRFVHLSTHAYVDAQHPESSGLVLSMVDRNGKEQDGILRLAAILNMPLRADLVVLSACETGAGHEIKTEGIFGLTQAFVYAGAQQVVSSVWPVDEFGTREIMTRFYGALLLRGLKPAAAMRAAQLSMKQTKAWASPAIWAAFLVYGYSG